MADEQITKLHDEVKTSFEALKTFNDRQEAEIKKFGEATAETKAALDRANDAIANNEAEIKKLQTRLSRPAAGGESKGERSEAETKTAEAFRLWATKGDQHLGADERKALSASDDTGGGYLAPKEYAREIIKTITEFSPVRSVANVRQTSARSLMIPKRTGQFAAAWVAETGTRAETTGLAFGMTELQTHEMYAIVDVSTQMLEDSAFDLEAFIAAEAAEQFAVAEGTAFISGNGVGKPEGILTNGDVAYSAGGHASAIQADGLIGIFYDLKDAYARNASWMFKRSTIKAIRQLKDSQNQYLWQPGLAGGAPATILDRPYLEATDIPAVGANALAGIFGDIRRAYTVLDRVSMSITRDPYTMASTGLVRFWVRKRVNGQIVLPEAVRTLKISVS
jgi:HK97 family phage major capsid protein